MQRAHKFKTNLENIAQSNANQDSSSKEAFQAHQNKPEIHFSGQTLQNQLNSSLGISDLIKSVKTVRDIPAWLRLTGETRSDSESAQDDVNDAEKGLSSEEDVVMYAQMALKNEGYAPKFPVQVKSQHFSGHSRPNGQFQSKK